MGSTPLPVDKLSDDAAAVLAGLETVMVGAGDGVDSIKKIKTYDKLKALDALSKHLGFFQEHNSQKHPDFVEGELHPALLDMVHNVEKRVLNIDK